MPAIYYIPSGPANLGSLFPSLNWRDIDQYYITSGSMLTTPIFEVVRCDEDVIISFVNYLGQIDSIGFKAQIEHEVKANTYQRATTYPLVRAFPGVTRLAIKSNDNYTGVCILQEEQMNWLSEFLDSPLAWIQQNGDYIPILIHGQGIFKQKIENRYVYEVEIKFSLSHSRIVIAN